MKYLISMAMMISILVLWSFNHLTSAYGLYNVASIEDGRIYPYNPWDMYLRLWPVAVAGLLTGIVPCILLINRIVSEHKKALKQEKIAKSSVQHNYDVFRKDNAKALQMAWDELEKYRVKESHHSRALLQANDNARVAINRELSARIAQAEKRKAKLDEHEEDLTTRESQLEYNLIFIKKGVAQKNQEVLSAMEATKDAERRLRNATATLQRLRQKKV